LSAATGHANVASLKKDIELEVQEKVNLDSREV